jgi:hypothetical protein
MEAVTQFEGRDLKRHTLLQVGQAYLDHLLSEQKFDEAGQLCLKILGESCCFMMKLPTAWESYFILFFSRLPFLRNENRW